MNSYQRSGVLLLAISAGLFGWGLRGMQDQPKPTAAPGSHSPQITPPPSQEPAVSSLSELPAESPSSLLDEGSSKATGGPQAPQEAFHSELVKAFLKQHPNSPLRFVPKDASADQIRYLEAQTEEIVGEWQQRRAALLSQFGDDLLSFCQDQRVLDNDRERQEKLQNLVRSLFP